MAIKTTPVDIHELPEPFRSTAQIKAFADQFLGADPGVKLLASLAWMAADSLEFERAEKPENVQQEEGMHDQERSMKRVKLVASIKELAREA